MSERRRAAGGFTPRRLAVPVAVGVVLMGATAAVQDTAFRGSVESKLTDSAHSAVAKAGVDDAQVSFSGRDGKVTARSDAAAAKAGAAVADVTGVRVVHAFGPKGEVSLDGARAARVGSGKPSEAPASAAASSSASAPAASAPAASGSGASAAPGPSTSASPSASAAPGVPTSDERTAARATLAKLGQITFATDSDTLTAAGMKVVQQAAAELKEYPHVTVRVEGFTDSQGSAAHGLVLSDRRAKRVVSELVKLGIASDRMTSKGYGETHQIPGTAAENRRVEFVVTN